MVNSHKDLVVWQKSVNLVVEVYKLTRGFPKEEIYGLTSQMRRAAVSIPSNIAEGRLRGTRKDFTQFLRVAYGSAGELETQIEIAQKLDETKGLDYAVTSSLLSEVMKMLNRMISNLSLPRS